MIKAFVLRVSRKTYRMLQNFPNWFPVVYEPTPFSGSPGLESPKSGGADGSMFDEGRTDVPDSSSSQDRTSSTPTRSPHPRHRLPSGRLLQPPGYVVSSAYHSSENIHNLATSSSSHHFLQPYNRRPVYASHLNLSQPSTRTPYAYPQQYHSGVPDNSMISQNVHPSYQHMMQPPSVYHYQHHSSGSASTLSSPIYSHHQVNPPTPPRDHFPPSSAGQSGVRSSSYHGPGQFQALRYPSPINPHYAYHSHSYPSSPIYPSPYATAPAPYYHSPMEPDRQSGWWYYPPVPSPHQYEGSPYLGHYSVSYPPHHENSSSVPSPSSPTAPGLYPTPLTLSQSSSTPGQPAASTSPINTGASSSVADVSNNKQSTSEKPLIRRSYHPNPPPHRSEWVMWAGNVPSDATRDELWLFFNQPPDPSSENLLQPGVLSIFPIPRSCCAFVNFESERQLHQSIKRFNGKMLRPDDPRCPRLVCRVRRKDDDLKAGVGGQRGMGVHTRWVKDQKAKAEDSSHSLLPTGSADTSVPDISTSSLSGDEEGSKRTAKYSSSSGSYASTNSSVLTRHFPERYFILKSLTQVSRRMVKVLLRVLTLMISV